MEVVYCCNEKYTEIFATSLVSLFENNKNEAHLLVYLIENGLSECSKARIRELAQKYNREVSFISQSQNHLLIDQNISLPKAYSLDTFSRLLIASYLPESVNRVIYIDCDTLVLGSLRQLWESDLEGNMVAMVNDCENPSYRKSLGLTGTGIYYNAGVFLADLDIWRSENIENKFIEYIVDNNGYIPVVDQGVLNAVLDGRIQMLPLMYNVSTVWYAFTYKELCRLRMPRAVYSENEADEACRHPRIVHFTNNFYIPIRPWINNCTHPYAEVWLGYRKLTPWKENELWNDSRSTVAKMYSSFCHRIPKSLVIAMSRLIQTYLFPLWHRYKKWIMNR